MDNNELLALVRQTARESFGREFQGTVAFNSRFRTRGGDVDVRRRHIRVSQALMEAHGPEAVVGVIKHELCHLFLADDGFPYGHRSPRFKTMLAAIGAPRFAPGSRDSRPAARYVRYYYHCRWCGSRFAANKRLNMVCPQCRRGPLTLTGKRHTIHPLKHG